MLRSVATGIDVGGSDPFSSLHQLTEEEGGGGGEGEVGEDVVVPQSPLTPMSPVITGMFCTAPYVVALLVYIRKWRRGSKEN